MAGSRMGRNKHAGKGCRHEADRQEFDVVVFYSDEDAHGVLVDRELLLVSTFLPGIPKELLMFQEHNQED